MQRLVVIGNSGGGKSTLARRLAVQSACPCVEIDSLLWQPGWRLAPVETYEAEHERLIAQERWIIDGLGRQESIPRRADRHAALDAFLAVERQLQWAADGLTHPPAGIAKMPRTEVLFRTIWEVEQTWMPEIRSPVAMEGTAREACGTADIGSDLENFALPQSANSN
jgi:hypothetical protein